MLHVTFQVGDQRYAIPTTEVLEIVPFVTPTPLANTPEHVIGLIRFRGVNVPVIDLVQLLEGRFARRELSSRVLVVDYPVESDKRPLGLLVERALETERFEPEAFADPGYDDGKTPFLGGVAATESGAVRRFQADLVLPEELRAALFTE